MMVGWASSSRLACISFLWAQGDSDMVRPFKLLRAALPPARRSPLPGMHLPAASSASGLR